MLLIGMHDRKGSSAVYGDTTSLYFVQQPSSPIGYFRYRLEIAGYCIGRLCACRSSKTSRVAFGSLLPESCSQMRVFETEDLLYGES